MSGSFNNNLDLLDTKKIFKKVVDSTHGRAKLASRVGGGSHRSVARSYRVTPNATNITI